MTVEIVHGRQSLAAMDAAPSHAFNMDGRRERVGELPAVSYGPSHVRRLGHLVLESADPPLRTVGITSTLASQNPTPWSYQRAHHK